MQIYDLADIPDTPITRFDSRGFTIGQLAQLNLPGTSGRSPHVTIAQLANGGVIGKHPAVGAQLMIPIIGTVRVSGADDVAVAIGPGQGVLWADAEAHRTEADFAAVLLIIEGKITTLTATS